MNKAFESRRFRSLLSYFLLGVAIIVAYKIIQEVNYIFDFLNRILSIISPFISGFLMAYILNIPCGGMQKLLSKSNNTYVKRSSKVLSIIIVYLLLLLILFVLLSLVIPSVYTSITLFYSRMPLYYSSAEDIILYINELNILNINISMYQIMSSIRNFGMEKLPLSINALFSVPSVLFKGFLTLISSIYMLVEKDKLYLYFRRLLKAFTPDTVYDIIIKYTHDLNNNFTKYIYTQTIDGCILGTVATIELFALGSPYALILGLMLGIVNYIPYFGSIVGSIVAIIIVAFTQGLPRAVITAVILLITQQIDGNVIQPKLLGGSFSLSPLLVIISITIGGAFAGILGMIVAIPIIAVIKNLLEEIVIHYEQQKLSVHNKMLNNNENGQDQSLPS